MGLRGAAIVDAALITRRQVLRRRAGIYPITALNGAGVSVDPDVNDDVPWQDLEPEDPSLSSQLEDDEEEDEEDQPRDEAGRFARQDEEEDEEDSPEDMAAKDVDITIVDVDEEIEDGKDEEDEPAYQLPQVPA